MMVVADPDADRRPAPEHRAAPRRPARRRLLHDPRRSCAAQDGQPLRVHRPPGARRTLATDVARRARRRRGFRGSTPGATRCATYPAGDVAANLIGFMGTDEPLGGLERTFDKQLAGTDGKAT